MTQSLVTSGQGCWGSIGLSEGFSTLKLETAGYGSANWSDSHYRTPAHLCDDPVQPMRDMKKRYWVAGTVGGGVAVYLCLVFWALYELDQSANKCNQGNQVACDELLDLPHPEAYSEKVTNPYFTTGLKAVMKARAEAKADAAQAKADATRAEAEAIK